MNKRLIITGRQKDHLVGNDPRQARPQKTASLQRNLLNLKPSLTGARCVDAVQGASRTPANTDSLQATSQADAACLIARRPLLSQCEARSAAHWPAMLSGAVTHASSKPTSGQ
jgi:hypothetical protein